MTRKQVALVVWLCLPVLAVAGLCYVMASTLSMDSRSRLREMYPPRGAGAGDTGGVNAVGEMLAGRAANHGRPLAPDGSPLDPGKIHPERYPRGFVIEVRDASGQHPLDQPLFLRGPTWTRTLTPDGAGLWRGEFIGEEGAPLWSFVVSRGRDGPDESLPADATRRSLPAFEAATLADGTKPRIAIVVTAWAGDE